MPIYVKDNIFVLETERTQYVFGIDNSGLNRHLHWGAKCDPADFFIETFGDENSNHTMLDEYRQEYTVFGSTMYRECALKVRFPDGCRELDLQYDGFAQEGDTLEVQFSDRHYPLKVRLCYELTPGFDVFTRWVRLENTGDRPILLEKVCSAEFSLPSQKPYTFRNTNGAWGGEGIECVQTLTGGALVFESRRGISGHNQSPYFIAYQNADEASGDVYFAALAYSGNFKVSAARDLYSFTRIHVGLNDFDFSYTLQGGESFETPKVFCGLAKGFGDMSRQMHKFTVQNVLPQAFAEKPLPVLYNSWEATGFDVNAENQMRLAEKAAAAGVELFVMDDGWFGARNNDRAGLGDWFVNSEKFPNGLQALISHVNSLGMDFGIWVEPEMVNADSDLYRAHPDWTYHYDTRTPHELRNQRVLNLTRADVQAYLFELLDRLLTENNIRYIKWDMNRPFSETGADNLENPQMLWYLHTMAVYTLVDRLRARHPQVQFESCASGGGRSDLGALSHFDEVWPSDNTDAIDRMTLQKTYTLLRPVKTMRAWVTDVGGPNKPTSLEFRFNIAMQGALSLGGDLTKYSEADMEICRENVALYKEIRPLVQFGDLYRLADADEDEFLCTQYVNKSKTESVVFLAARGTRFYKKRVILRLAGLDPVRRYRLEFDGKMIEKSGAYLMEAGLAAHIRGADYNTVLRLFAV